MVVFSLGGGLYCSVMLVLCCAMRAKAPCRKLRQSRKGDSSDIESVISSNLDSPMAGRGEFAFVDLSQWESSVSSSESVSLSGNISGLVFLG